MKVLAVHQYVRHLIFTILVSISFAAHSVECYVTKPENFTSFFEKFSHNQKFSVSRTIYPLKIETSYYGIDAQGKETTGINTVLRSKREDAKLDSLYLEMKKNDLSFKILSLDEKTAVVNVSGVGDDMLFNHHFIRIGNCWFQDFIENYSL